MTPKDLAAPCGIHCGMCTLNRAVKDEALRIRVAQRLGIATDKARCNGCRAVDGNCPVIGEQCATWVCVKGKGVEFCSECADFPCQKLMPCADRADNLPHNIKLYSLTLRKFKGDEVWEKEVAQVYALYHAGKMVIGRGPQPQPKAQ